MRQALKIVRILIDLLLLFSATGVLIQGGLSRYARYGLPPQTDWRLILFGLLLAAAGGFLVRPGYFFRGHSK